eukprot:5830407-Alexandrium_andersonii.AAC.1
MAAGLRHEHRCGVGGRELVGGLAEDGDVDIHRGVLLGTLLGANPATLRRRSIEQARALRRGLAAGFCSGS